MPSATNARRITLAFAVAAAFVTYLDRICISVAAPSITEDLGLTTAQMGYVFSVFALAYGAFEIPMGWAGDRFGQKRLMARIVIAWSLFTALTGLVRGYLLLVAVRFLFGAAQAGAFPTLTRALARWFPPGERGRSTGLMWMGARLGGAVAPPLAALMIVLVGWRLSFVVFGVSGLVWCQLFWRWYRDDPADHPAVNEAELRYIRSGAPAQTAPTAIPWGRLLADPNLWALFAMYFCSAYGFYFFVTWLPTYLIDEHGLTLAQSGLYSAFPLLAGACACITGGAFSDWLVRKKGLRWGRRLVGIGGFGLAAVGFALAATAGDALSAVLWMAFAQGAQDLTLPVAWAVCVDVGHRYGGTATGFMNTASSASAVISPISAAWLAAMFGSFESMFWAATVVYLIGALLWFAIDPERRVRG
ncbi:MAG: MFS transporter [Bryobacterales bacterium]|nr:MFS transporter [Bryobacterales bacterium]